MTSYLDSSAAAKLLVDEAESDAVATYLDQVTEGSGVVSSALLETELRRLAVREELSQQAVSLLLERVDMVEPSRSLFHEAGLLPGRGLRSLDALHLATALRMEVDEVVSFDERMLEAARNMGLSVHRVASAARLK